MTELIYKKRSRVNFSTSVKGIVTPEVTVELIDGTNEEIIKEATELYDLAKKVADERTKGE